MINTQAYNSFRRSTIFAVHQYIGLSLLDTLWAAEASLAVVFRVIPELTIVTASTQAPTKMYDLACSESFDESPGVHSLDILHAGVKLG